jgi:hypothetical protein
LGIYLLPKDPPDDNGNVFSSRIAANELRNIFQEYHDDLGYPEPSNGDLTPWAEQGEKGREKVGQVGRSGAATSVGAEVIRPNTTVSASAPQPAA